MDDRERERGREWMIERERERERMDDRKIDRSASVGPGYLSCYEATLWSREERERVKLPREADVER